MYEYLLSQSLQTHMKAEAYSDPVKRRRQDRLKEAKKNISKSFVPSSGSKKM